MSVNVPRPFGITLYEDSIYWTDKLNKGVYSANKFNGSAREVIVSQLDNVMDIKMFYKPQPKGKTISVKTVFFFCNLVKKIVICHLLPFSNQTIDDH